MRKSRIAWVLGAIVVVLIFGVMGPSPMPPPGPLDAGIVTPSPERAKVITAMSDWLAAEAGGRAVQFYSVTWEGGQSATGPYADNTAFYSGFKGMILVGYWPFVLPYGGLVDDNPIDGYRVEGHVDKLKPSTRTAESLTPAERQDLLRRLKPLLAATGVGVSYDFADMASWTAVAQDASGTLALTAALPPRTPLAPRGELRIRFSDDLKPVLVTATLPVE